MRPLLSLFGADPSLDHQHPFETSWCLPPLVLAGYRAIVAIYIFFCIFFIFGWYATHDEDATIGQSFSYFTWLNFWGMGFYFLVASIHTFVYAAIGRSAIFNKLPRAFIGLHSLFYTCVTTFPFLVVIIFWAILYSGSWYTYWFGAWSNISQHGLIGFYALLEVFLTTTPPHPLLHLAFLILLLLLYLALAYLTHKTEGFYTYSFLDPGNRGQHSGKVAGYAFAILAAIIVIFAVTWFLIWSRRKLTGGRIKRARKDRELVYSNQRGRLGRRRGMRSDPVKRFSLDRVIYFQFLGLFRKFCGGFGF
ncbi:hypothetical protein BGW36DRAFT_134419 [Talaromyces proteolyticus]|uniref:Uncharacterized protein n=1 Tax=Talaromyces proteolyticus TaxID=1131652 RepID=A0AAD4PY33_9EURO|nr:uncharacterized protein BGW36DRAFT_134419 [Talaromyces proteolyticus]KAH8700685.1 hypothetical protein BGW36DRAFT_134419 [Talaromyces proteolyticus]